MPQACGTSKLSRYDASVRALVKAKAELGKARARAKQEKQLSLKRARYAERNRVDSELRTMGRMCQTIGLSNFRLEPVRDEVTGQIDELLIVGGLALLVQTLGEMTTDEREKIKQSGSDYMQRYVAQQAAKQHETKE